jgi:hypothetical protein
LSFDELFGDGKSKSRAAGEAGFFVDSGNNLFYVSAIIVVE